MSNKIVTLDIGGKAELKRDEYLSYSGLVLRSPKGVMDAQGFWDYNNSVDINQTLSKGDRPIIRISDALMKDFAKQGITAIQYEFVADNGTFLRGLDSEGRLIELGNFLISDLFPAGKNMPSIQLGEKGPIIPGLVTNAYRAIQFKDAKAWSEIADRLNDPKLPEGDVFRFSSSRYDYAEVAPQRLRMMNTDVLDLHIPQDQVVVTFGKGADPKSDPAHIRTGAHIRQLQTKGRITSELTIEVDGAYHLDLNHRGDTHLIFGSGNQLKITGSNSPQKLTFDNRFLSYIFEALLHPGYHVPASLCIHQILCCASFIIC